MKKVKYMQQRTIQRNEVGTQPSSIGLAWPPRYDSWNNRVKGFANGLIETSIDAHKFGTEAISSWNAEKTQNPTRLSLRLIVSSTLFDDGDPKVDGCIPTDSTMEALINRLRREIGQNVRIEAEVSLRHILPGFDLIYLGFNSDSRIAPSEVSKTESEVISGINREIAPTSQEEAYSRLQRAGLRIERLSQPTEMEISRITQLYRDTFQMYLFPISESTVGEIVGNSNLVLVGRNGAGEIISSLIAEHVKMNVADRQLHLIELSEFATDRAYRGNGLITALQFRAVEMLRQLYDPNSSVIYSEGRAPWIPVNISIRRAGFNFCGILPQHCTIVSDRSPGMQYSGVYEDLSVWSYNAR